MRKNIELDSTAEFLRKCNEQVMELRINKPQGWLKQCMDVYEQVLAQEQFELPKAKLAGILYGYAQLLQRNNQVNRAVEVATEGVALHRKLCKAKPEIFQPKLATTIGLLAQIHEKLGQQDTAEQEYREAIAIFKELTADSEKYVKDLARHIGNLAVLHSNQGQLEQAETEYKETIRLYESLSTSLPDTSAQCTALFECDLAILHCQQHQYDQAAKEYMSSQTKLRTLAEQGDDENMHFLAHTLSNMGGMYSETKKYAQSERAYREALEIYQQLAAKSPEAFQPCVTHVERNIARLHRLQQRE
ncbi:MAG: tetratricopeptide repeat protein [Bacteroidales bacterium]|nr:tetratricopeptide repeat protein [Bacteroidales bacterium]